MTAGLAALPMYDWPELRAATDGLWAALRDALRAEGVAAPEALSREISLMEGWTDPRLVLGQTCGLPLVRDLAGRIAVVGALDYAVPGCPPGWYRSAVVVREGDARTTLAAFRGARLAVNGFDSQSGWGSILHHVAPLEAGVRFFDEIVVSGAHAESVPMVAGGAADLAAIDFVSWGYARRFRPEAAAALRVLMLTDPTPGLPLIAAPTTDVVRHRRAVRAALAGLDATIGEALGIAGFAALDAGDYRVVAERFAAAGAARA
jgi:ABC-type phosphate/phosphonate transport system substrate-binding protein